MNSIGGWFSAQNTCLSPMQLPVQVCEFSFAGTIHPFLVGFVRALLYWGAVCVIITVHYNHLKKKTQNEQ